jgi:hypothetical protein
MEKEKKQCTERLDVRILAHRETIQELPAFSKPYKAFFCSSSSCCLLCLHTKHLEDKTTMVCSLMQCEDLKMKPLGLAHSRVLKFVPSNKKSKFQKLN